MKAIYVQLAPGILNVPLVQNCMTYVTVGQMALSSTLRPSSGVKVGGSMYTGRAPLGITLWVAIDTMLFTNPR